MRYVIANWKMQLGVGESAALAGALAAEFPGPVDGVAVAVCPTFAELSAVGGALSGSGVALGSQDVAAEQKGAFTGEVSASELAELGCAYAIVGHSERRAQFGETDAQVRHKAVALLSHGIVPVVCVGESRDDQQSGITATVVKFQIAEALRGLPEGPLIVAYEPRWAIGTGLAAAPADAARAAAAIREACAEVRPGAACPVLYGGSVDESNVGAFVGAEGIDGVLVGTASLRHDGFAAIVRAVASL
jgi:triosephosphate isomerase